MAKIYTNVYAKIYSTAKIDADNDNIPYSDYCGYIETELMCNIRFDKKEKINWFLDWINAFFFAIYLL